MLDKNMFADCKTQSELIKKMFEVSSIYDFDKSELMKLVNKRKKEIESEIKSSSLTSTKIRIPAREYNISQDSLLFTKIGANYLTSDTIIFMGNSKVMF